MKHLANGITLGRIVFSILLLFLLHQPVLYSFVYIVCGLSDVVDGYIARKTNTQSTLGARLDSAADVLLFFVLTFSMIVWAGASLGSCLILVIVIVVIRVLNAVFAAVKYHSFVFLHTWGNKLTGLLVFFIPVLYLLCHTLTVVKIICVISILAALEESAIHLTSKNYDLNRKSLFYR